MYDVIVLGATFTAAGIAHTFKKNCLILEQSFQAGSEFFGALQFGSGYDNKPKRNESAALQERFLDSDMYSWHTEIYPYLQQADILFGTQVSSIQKTDNGFLCVAYGVQGFYTYEAKQIIDTRSNEEISVSKTFNLLIESSETPVFSGVFFEKAGLENHYILHLPVPLSCGYPEARKMAQNVVRQFSETQKLILSASVFDYQIKADYPKKRDDILRLPSKAYNNPILAFEVGLEVTL